MNLVDTISNIHRGKPPNAFETLICWHCNSLVTTIIQMVSSPCCTSCIIQIISRTYTYML